MQALLERLAERLVDFRTMDMPELAVNTAVEAITDTVAVLLAGADEPGLQALIRATENCIAPGPAWCVARSRGVDILSAALINGMAAHALDFDDCSNSMGGHPSAPLLPALMALTDQSDVDGATFLRAYLAGFETETRLGRAANFEHYEKGWHPTATLGTFGAAASAAALLNLDARATARALAIAASMAAGIKANFGTDVKPFHVGQSARNGLLAALMAAEGLSANPDALEHPQGFFRVYNGEGRYDADRLLADWAAPLDIEEVGIAYKQHPCCASTHPAVDVALALRRDHGITPDQIVAVRSLTHPRRLRHTNRPDPKSGLEGKFSVQYALARALAEGVVRPDVFNDTEISRPEIRDLMARITAAPHPQADMASTEHFFAEVEIELTDGRLLRGEIDRPLGRDRDHPLPKGALRAKFMACTAPRLGEAGAAALDHALAGLPAAASCQKIFAALRTDTDNHQRKSTADA